jgi:hypothetical protein
MPDGQTIRLNEIVEINSPIVISFGVAPHTIQQWVLILVDENKFWFKRP